MKRIIAASMTPFTDSDEVDLESAEKMYEFNLKHKIDGFFLFGTMGEWALTSSSEKDKMAEHACDVIGDRGKILLGVQDIGLPQMLANMERMKKYSHHGWVIMFPQKFAAPRNPVKFVHGIADTADRPVYLYYSPSFNGTTLEPAEFEEILAHDNVSGIKNSADSIRTRKELLIIRRKMDFEFYEGQEWSVDESLLLGCDGAVAGFGTCGSKILKMIADSVDGGNADQAWNLQARLIDIFEKVYGRNREHVWSGQKQALVHMGVLNSARTRVDGQDDISAGEIEIIRKCVDENRDYLV